MYDNVSSLRSRKTVVGAGIKRFGFSRSNVFLGIRFDPLSEEQQRTEHEAVTGQLEELTPLPPDATDFNWYKENQPHISLVKVDVDIPRTLQKQMINDLSDIVIGQTIHLDRATFSGLAPN